MIVVVIGPTGIGKTRLGVALAKHFATDVISGDSVQVYRGLDIGSAKVTEEEKHGVTHHLIDVLDPSEEFSVALYQTMVRAKIKELEDAGKLPLIVGGTGLYIKSVLYDYNFTDTRRDPKEEEKYDDLDNERLHQLLQDKDPDAAAKIHPNNRKRVLHAITRSDRNKVSDNTNKDMPVYDFVILGLTMERKTLYAMLDKRVDQMIADGLIDEVRGLYNKGIRSNATKSISYRELYRHFDGEWTLDHAIAKIKQHNRNLARKQYTFFRNQFPIRWLEVDPDQFETTIAKAITIVEEERNQ